MGGNVAESCVAMESDLLTMVMPAELNYPIDEMVKSCSNYAISDRGKVWWNT